jgi:hypothetical protein
VRCLTRGDRSRTLALRSSSGALRSVPRAPRSTTLGDRSGTRPVDSGTRAPHGATRRQRNGLHVERNGTRPARCGMGWPFFPTEPHGCAARRVLVEEGPERDGIEMPPSPKDLLFIDDEQVRSGTVQVLGGMQRVRSPEQLLFVDERRLPPEQRASVPEWASSATESGARPPAWFCPRGQCRGLRGRIAPR